MDNLNPIRAIKTHVVKIWKHILNNPMSFLGNNRGFAGESTEADIQAGKDFRGTLPEGVRENESLAGFNNAGDIATAYLDAKGKVDAGPMATWKDKLSGDLAKTPGLEKFSDDAKGLSGILESYNNLEKLLGHDKVPIPKGPEDTEGWSRFSKALGIPDKAEGYGLADATIPETMKNMAFDKQGFAELVHSFKLTPSQAKGLWGAYTEKSMKSYNKAIETQKTDMTKVVNQLKSEWGDTYEANVDLGQMVINKFSVDKEGADYITALLSTDPKSIKFLAKIGEQFAENKIGDFGYKRFSLAPEEAEKEINTILADKSHPYNNDKSPSKDRNAAIDYVNSLYAIINKAKQG